MGRPDVERLAGHARDARLGLGHPEGLLGQLLALLLVLPGSVGHHDRIEREGVERDRDRHRGHPGLHALGEENALPDRHLGQRGPVGGDQDVLEHGLSPQDFAASTRSRPALSRRSTRSSRTSAPCSRNSRATWLPMKPVAPET